METLTATIPLHGKYAAGRVAIVDASDEAEALKHSWCVTPRGYAITKIFINGKPRLARMHNILFGDMQERDHRNRNPLDNRRENLRPATRGQNTANRDGWSGRKFNGVFPKDGKWAAKLAWQRKQYWSKRFLTQEEAAAAYDEMAIKYHCEFARLNFPAEATA